MKMSFVHLISCFLVFLRTYIKAVLLKRIFYYLLLQSNTHSLSHSFWVKKPHMAYLGPLFSQPMKAAMKVFELGISSELTSHLKLQPEKGLSPGSLSDCWQHSDWVD